MPDQKTLYAGVDIGGTNIKIGLVDDQANTAAYESIPTQADEGPERAAQRCAETLQRLSAQAGVELAGLKGMGLASPGPMDIPKGVLLCPGNLPEWHNTPLRDLFAGATGLPTTYGNDANAAAYGEFWGGAGARFNSLVMLTLGTGVGGGIVLHDSVTGTMVIDGEHSVGGEIGHIIINSEPDAPLNSLGIRGSLEGYCGSYGVVGQAERKLADPAIQSSLRDSAKTDAGLTPLVIAQAAEAGDEVALSVVMETARYLAIGIVTSVHMIDPEAVVIGGAMTFGGAGHTLGERFLAEVRNQVLPRLIPSLRDQLVIEFAQLGGKAGYIGAAGLARRALGA